MSLITSNEYIIQNDGVFIVKTINQPGIRTDENILDQGYFVGTKGTQTIEGTKSFNDPIINNTANTLIKTLVVNYNGTIPSSDIAIIPSVVPPSQPSVVGSSSNGQLIPSTTYSYAVTFANELYGETSFSPTVSITLSSFQTAVQLTIPVSTSPFTKKRIIYRTKANTSTFFFLAVIDNNTTTTFIDRIAEINLGSNSTSINRFNSLIIFSNNINSAISQNLYSVLSTSTIIPLSNSPIYFNERNESVLVYSTTLFSPGNVTATVSNLVGNLTPGKFNYVMTSVVSTPSGDFETSITTPTTIFLLTNTSVYLSNLEISSVSNVSSKKIYRTKVNGSVYFLVTTLVNSATLFLDNTSDDDLTVPLPSYTSNNIGIGNPHELTPVQGSSGNIPAGTYSYIVTFVDSNSIESSTSPPVSITIPDLFRIVLNNLPLGPTISVGDSETYSSNITRRNIYRSNDGGVTYRRITAGTTLNNNTSTSFTDNTASISSNPTPPTQTLSVKAPGSLIGIATAGTGIANGIMYKYRISYLYDISGSIFESIPGVESRYTRSNVISGQTAFGQITLTNLPISPIPIVGRKVYRLQSGLNVPYSLIATIDNNVDTTFIDTGLPALSGSEAVSNMFSYFIVPATGYYSFAIKIDLSGLPSTASTLRINVQTGSNQTLFNSYHPVYSILPFSIFSYTELKLNTNTVIVFQLYAFTSSGSSLSLANSNLDINSSVNITQKNVLSN